MGVTREQVRRAIEQLPADKLEEAWLLVEALLSNGATASPTAAVPSKIEGAFPELDLDLDVIENILRRDEADRLSRATAGI